jgi:geranylgeranyl diphosphate synthase type I
VGVLSDDEAIAAIEAEMRATMDAARDWLATGDRPTVGGAALVEPLWGMMRYHLGWDDASFRPARSDGGKKLRGQLCLLACALMGGDATRALPLAAAVELLHTFTLVHDDIQDQSPVRHHRPTVWRIWGMPQAINVGDGLNALARLALLRLIERGAPAALALALARDCERTLLHIMEGQYLDMSFEADWSATPALYERMIAGKTASLIGFCLEAGGRVGGATPDEAATLARCGHAIGLGFQVRDDILDIWGDPATTGKPPAADIRSRKKSLPVLLAMETAGEAERAIVRAAYARPTLDDADVAAVLAVLADAGARARSQARVEAHHDAALAALASLGRENEATTAIRSLLTRLVAREF